MLLQHLAAVNVIRHVHWRRPFLWKGGIYATASVWGEDSSFVWECILRVDLDQRRLATEYCFDKMPIRTNVTM